MQGGNGDVVSEALLLDTTRAKERLEKQVAEMRADINILLRCTLVKKISDLDTYQEMKTKYYDKESGE